MVIFRDGHAFACVLLVFLAVVIAQGYVTAQTAQTVAPKVTIELSPATINAGSKTTLAVTVSNPGNSSFTYSQLNITTIIPPYWECESDDGADCSIHSVLNLMKGQSTLTEYRILIPSNASQGDYFIHVRVSWNQTYSAIYSGRVSVQFVLGPTLPGEIPFVLAVMILPGFIAFAIGVYLSGSKLSDCSVLQVVLVSILLGAFIWQTGGLSIILATSNPNILLNTLFNFNPNLQNIWVRTGLIAFAIAIAARFGAFVSWGWQGLKLGAMSADRLRHFWYQRIEGYDKVQITNTAWETQLSLSRRHHRRGYRTKITLTLSDKASATSDQSKTSGQTKTPPDQSKPSEETKTSDQSKTADQAKTLSGLFVAGDVNDPLNLILDPQYIVEAEDLVSLQRLLASKFSLMSFLHSWRRLFRPEDGIKDENFAQLNDSLGKDGSLIENALVKARHGIEYKDKDNHKHKYKYKISAANNGDFVKGRTLIREQVLRWEISPEPELIAKFKIQGNSREIPTEAPDVDWTWSGRRLGRGLDADLDVDWTETWD